MTEAMRPQGLEDRLTGRTLERPYQELRGDTKQTRRLVQITNLEFKLGHAEELRLSMRKIDRMERELDRLRTSYRISGGRVILYSSFFFDSTHARQPK